MLVPALEDVGHVRGKVIMLVDRLREPSIKALVALAELGYFLALAVAVTAVYPKGKNPSFALTAVQTVFDDENVAVVVEDGDVTGVISKIDVIEYLAAQR